MPKLIIGLGNPGSEYAKTRHSLGAAAVGRLAEELGATFKLDKKNKAEVAVHGSGDSRLILAKPTTFMNSSGEAVRALVDFYKLSPADVVVVYDDVDIPFGKIKKTGTSAGGHNGVKSVIAHLGGTGFGRLRLGIKPEGGIKGPTEKFVLQKFSLRERLKLGGFLERVIEEVT